MSHEIPYFRRGWNISYKKALRNKNWVTLLIFRKIKISRSPKNALGMEWSCCLIDFKVER